MKRPIIKLAILANLVKSCHSFSTLLKMSTSSSTTIPSNHILYDVPVSNNGARCRIILYKKGIPESEVKIVSPMELGGLKSAEFLALNPQGKMPLLTISSPGDGDICSIPESDTISRYLLSEYTTGPSFLPNNVKSNLISRLHDMYLTTIQGCMYKATPPFGPFPTRKDALLEYCKQLRVIDDLLDEKTTTYLCGNEVSLADATLFPSLVFATYILPKFVISSKQEEQESLAVPNKLASWYQNVIENDDVFSRVHDEMTKALESWDNNKRWDTILHAGLRDTAPSTIFDKILNSEIPSTIVRDHPKYVAFKDINPAAPNHVLIIPKDRANLTHLHHASADHVEILGTLLAAAGEIVNDPDLGFDGAGRIVINDSAAAGQEVFHLHLHVLGGRSFSWPPG